jgi:hypothetical protein
MKIRMVMVWEKNENEKEMKMIGGEVIGEKVMNDVFRLMT